MESDDSKQKRLSANYLMDFTPSVLTDGKLVYTRWEYVDRPACPIQRLLKERPRADMPTYQNLCEDPSI